MDALLAYRAMLPWAFRWADNQLFWVLDVLSRGAECRTVNRAAILVEKERYPPGRVLRAETRASALPGAAD